MTLPTTANRPRGPRSTWRPWVPALLITLNGCGQAYLVPQLHEPRIVPGREAAGQPLKVHMKSGDLYVLDRWQLADSGRQLTGSGARWGIWRDSARAVSVAVALDSVAVFETSSKETAFSLGSIGVGALTVLETYVAVVCLADPKSCFGSCPTFYVDGDDPGRVRAEGFSESVASVLERRDVDALDVGSLRGRTLTIRMRNEALETHMVRSVRVLAVPRPPGGSVVAVDDSLLVPVGDIEPASSCASRTGDCERAIAQRDDLEWVTRVDSTDLAAREIIELRFARAPTNAGLILTSRNTLVTTFLFYQTLAWLGREAGPALAAMERGTRADAKARFALAKALGGIDVLVSDDSSWRLVGTVGEAGPIAADTKVLALPAGTYTPGRPVHLRLRMAQGSWRIDWATLASVGAPVQPVRLVPVAVERNGAPDAGSAALLSQANRHLVSLPGDEFVLRFQLPLGADSLALFLESEGYYYEWIRGEWLAEEDAAAAALAFTRPADVLRRLAPAYAAREETMEALFWSSRFNRRPDHAPRVP